VSRIFLAQRAGITPIQPEGTPAGVTLLAPDIVPASYWASWSNTFPADNTFIPIGIWPAQVAPASAQAMNINFMVPYRDNTNGFFRPIYSGATNQADIVDVAATPGFYGGGAGFYRTTPSLGANITTVNQAAFSLPQASITVTSTAEFISADQETTHVGSFEVVSSAGQQIITYTGISGNTFTGCTGGTGTVSNGAAVGGVAWGNALAFNVFGDELDGGTGFFSIPSSIQSLAVGASNGGVTAASMQAMCNEARSIDASRPVYTQYASALNNPHNNPVFSVTDRQTFYAAPDIVSYDQYVIAIQGGYVYNQYDACKFARSYAVGTNTRPVMPFIETDVMPGYTVYPTPAQSVAEVWQSIVAGAQGIQYFDYYGNLPNASYTGNGTYTAGAMHNAILALNTELASIAHVINTDFASGFSAIIAGGGHVMAKYESNQNKFYTFVVPSAPGAQTIEVTFAGLSAPTVIQRVNGQTLAQDTVTTSAVTYPNYPQIILGDGAVAYWQLNENSGTIAYDTANSNVGTYIGTYTQAVTGPFTSLSANSGVNLAGTGYIQALGSGYLDLVDVHFSLETWIKASSTTPGNFKYIFSKCDNNGIGYFISTGSDGTIHFGFADQSGTVHSTASISGWNWDTAWHHIVCTYDGTTAIIYKDGVQVHSESISATSITTTTADDLRIGDVSIDTNNTYTFPGSFAHVAVYQKTLSPTQVQTHFNSTTQTTTAQSYAQAFSDENQAYYYIVPNVG
jgi:hypothetical protein